MGQVGEETASLVGGNPKSCAIGAGGRNKSRLRRVLQTGSQHFCLLACSQTIDNPLGAAIFFAKRMLNRGQLVANRCPLVFDLNADFVFSAGWVILGQVLVKPAGSQNIAMVGGGPLGFAVNPRIVIIQLETFPGVKHYMEGRP